MVSQLFDTANYILNSLTVQIVPVSAGAFCLGIFALGRERGSPVSVVFFLITLAISTWLFAYSWMYSAVDEQVAMWWAKAAYCGVVFVPAAIYHYAALLLRTYKAIRIRVAAVWFLAICFVVLIIMTDMVFGSLYHYKWGYYPKYVTTSIPFLIYFFGVIADVLRRFWVEYKRAAARPIQIIRTRKVSLLLIIFGCLACVDFIPNFGIQFYPFGYIPVFLFLVLSAYSIAHHQLLTITSAFAAGRIIDIMKDALIVVDREGIVRVVNQATCDLLGYTEKDLLGKPTKGLGNGSIFAEGLESILPGRMAQNFELEYKSKEDILSTLILSTSAMHDHEGELLAIVCLLRDITERKQMENTIQESEEQFRKMFEESPIGMVMSSADFLPIRINAAFCRMLGYTEQELISLTFKDITHPDHLAEDVLHLNDLISGKIPIYQTEKRYVRKDKGVAWGSVTVTIMHGRDDRFLYFLTTIEDITQRKQSEEEKKHLESQLFRAQKMEAIGTLAGGIAHDFNNILTALVGYAALLRMKIKNGTLGTYVDQILSASQKATDLVQSLLAFSRQQSVSLKPISIHSIIKGTEKLLKRLITEDIAIKTLLATEDITIMADATQIDQILFNLATNARDAMLQGGTLTIETKAVELGDNFQPFHGYGEPGRYALLCISDTGVGMDKATQERIFDPFFTTKEVGKGTGLGLSTVYGIVKQHNGHITVYSEPNIGTTFHIYLPVASKIGEEENLAPTPVKGGNETILIAEDSEAVRGLISKVLIEYGYTIVEAVDGAEAVERFKQADKIDLLILDSVMPNKNGREAYNEIHKIKPDIRVIFTSGYTRDVFLDKGIEDKKYNFLQKPISPDILLQKVRDVLDDRQDSH